jgi:2-oxoglutarate dehydrogenase E1 component
VFLVAARVHWPAMDRDLLELSGSLAFVDEMYARFQEDGGAIDPSWHEVLGEAPSARPARGTGNGRGNGSTAAAAYAPPPAVREAPPPAVREAPPRRRAATAPPVPGSAAARHEEIARAVVALVHAHRERGHLVASLDPLGLLEPPRLAELSPSFYGLADSELDTEVESGIAGLGMATVREVLDHLRATYSQHIGIELAHLDSQPKRAWLTEHMELRARRLPRPELRRRLLELLVQAEGFERFCHVKYPGTKRFSLEGSETLIPMLDQVIAHAARLGAIEAVIGMAHRGRLTALEMIMQRQARHIFAEFEDIEPEAVQGGGDVKYHLGYSCDRSEPDGSAIHLSLAFNPSHLEAVDPVVVGRVRAKQLRHHDWEHRRVVGVLVHGDAAFAGQGLVAETLQLHGLPGYRTGGTVHLIVNNQVGFTASPSETRSTPYCTDIAQMIQCPIWHVNGEDVDAVAQVVAMAMEYRATFASDVVIDLYCYRKYGHNEMDEPSFTQPLMYERIRQKESIVEIYGRRLQADGVLAEADAAAMVAARQRQLDGELEAARASRQRPRMQAGAGLWRGYLGGPASNARDVETGVPLEQLGTIAQAITQVPAGFTPHPKIVRLLTQRAEMGRGERPIDWGMAEMLAYGSLLWEGSNVRLTGQDVSRGTFSHRHVMVTDVRSGAEHSLLGHLHPEQGLPRIYDSPLSEAGVLGFEFGYSLDYPDALVMWEAQFGDFANGAQAIIDQFVVSAEDKWNRLSGLVMLLPHGYEGQGPEHSSARLERFLQLCAEDNIQVAQPTTPAQMFHLVRRQLRRSWRKPLVVMTPKSLLRLPAATSSREELAAGTYRRVIDDPVAQPGEADRLILCSGKIYYELVEERQRRGAAAAIVRMEEIYPWPAAALEALWARWRQVRHVLWVQDEPGNMGAAFFVVPRLERLLERPVTWVSRDESASPATGSHKAHVIEQERILRAAFEAA